VALAEAYGWRNSFFLAGIPGLVMAVLVAKTLLEPKVVEVSRTA
jgi:predicted MFS family arabinose efflux permease